MRASVLEQDFGPVRCAVDSAPPLSVLRISRNFGRGDQEWARFCHRHRHGTRKLSVDRQ